jgi:hypothetical protein
MASQTYATAPSRNPHVAAEGFGSGAKPGKVPVPQGGAVMGKAPANADGAKAGTPRGFAGGLIDGKVKV